MSTGPFVPCPSTLYVVTASLVFIHVFVHSCLSVRFPSGSVLIRPVHLCYHHSVCRVSPRRTHRPKLSLSQTTFRTKDFTTLAKRSVWMSKSVGGGVPETKEIPKKLRRLYTSSIGEGSLFAKPVFTILTFTNTPGITGDHVFINSRSDPLFE